MYLFYLIAFIPVLIGAILWVRNKEVVWWEWLLGTGIGFFLSLLFHISTSCFMGNDSETWSGKVTGLTYYPKWVEEYEETHYKTDDEGNTTTYTTTEHRTHYPYWTADLDYGSESYEKEIKKERYDSLKKLFGGVENAEHVYKSGFDSGDHNIYHVQNLTHFVAPVTQRKLFENRVKCCTNLFQFARIPEELKSRIYEYPENDNIFVSNRLLGSASTAVSIYEWDCMNSRLGPRKKVNVILIGFPQGDSMFGEYQRAKFIGGKKNDLVLCFGGNLNKPDWSFVFGWSESEQVKRDLETLLLNGISETFPNKVENIILRGNYKIKDWSKFDYLTIEPPTWSYVLLIFLMAIAQSLFWVWAHHNDIDKTYEIK